MKIVNLTGKKITFKDSGKSCSIPMCVDSCRVFIRREFRGKQEMETDYGEKFNLNLNVTHIGDAYNIPPKKDGYIYIVNQMVYNAISSLREDLYLPDEIIHQSKQEIVCLGITRQDYSSESKPKKPF